MNWKDLYKQAMYEGNGDDIQTLVDKLKGSLENGIDDGSVQDMAKYAHELSTQLHAIIESNDLIDNLPDDLSVASTKLNELGDYINPDIVEMLPDITTVKTDKETS